jgi:hypothetical protein
MEEGKTSLKEFMNLVRKHGGSENTGFLYVFPLEFSQKDKSGDR